MIRDPVCEMAVCEGSISVDGYPDVGFCSEHRRSAFVADPERYPTPDGGAAEPQGCWSVRAIVGRSGRRSTRAHLHHAAS